MPSKIITSSHDNAHYFISNRAKFGPNLRVRRIDGEVHVSLANGNNVGVMKFYTGDERRVSFSVYEEHAVAMQEIFKNVPDWNIEIYRMRRN